METKRNLRKVFAMEILIITEDLRKISAWFQIGTQFQLRFCVK